MSLPAVKRMTPQRELILEILRGVCSHPTAEEVYLMVKKRLPRISLGTVYRNLEGLSEGGLIRRLEVGGARRRYDGNVENHYHVRCVECGRVDDVDVGVADDLEAGAGRTSDYEITGHRILFVGVCSSCK